MPDAIPSMGGLQAVLATASALGADTSPGGEVLQPVGGMPGVMALLISKQRLSEGDYPFFLGRAAVGPAGEVVGVLVQSENLPGKVEETVLGQVAASVELLGVTFDADPQETMAAAGISFDPPEGVHFVRYEDAASPRLWLMGGRGQEAWYLELGRAPLVGQRTPAALVEDQVLSMVQEVRLPEAVEVVQAGDREAARVTVDVYTAQQPTSHVLAARTDPHTALLMIGRYEPKARGNMEDLCQSLATTAKVDSFDKLVDVAAALDAGRRMIREITQQGMTPVLSRREGRKLHFELRAPMLKLGTWVDTCRKMSTGGQTWWSIVDELVFTPPWPGRDATEKTEECRLADDGINYRYSFRHKQGPQMIVRETEVRVDDENTVQRDVVTRHGSKTDTIDVDNTYACGPVMMAVAAKLSRASKPESVVLSEIGTFTAGTAYSVMTPLGRTPLPSSNLKESGWTVQLTLDYDPSPVRLYFDEEGLLLGIFHDRLEWQVRLDESAESEEKADNATRAGR